MFEDNENIPANMPRRNPKRFKRNIFNRRGTFDDTHNLGNFEKLSSRRRSRKSDRISRRKRK